jgi:molybdopterin/thiamine biosynthesis adenylyltransferase
MLAFRPREREKRSLRRTNRIVEDEIIEELFSEFDTTLKIVDRIQMREELKLNQVSIQLSGFYYDCKSFIGQPDFFEEVKLEDRAKEKEKMKSMHSEIEEYRSRKESLDNIVVQEANGSDIDQKQTIANFLATAVYEAELLGISYEKIYYPNNSLVQEKSRSLQPAGQQILSEPVAEERMVPE